MSLNRLLAAFIAGVIVFMASPTLAFAEGVGIYPINLDIGDAYRGATYYRTVGVINDGNAPRTFRLAGAGETGGWVTFVDPETRTKKMNQVTADAHSQAQVVLKLALPASVANGRHLGTIRAVTVLTKTKRGASVNFVSQSNLVVNVAGTQSIAGGLADVSVRDTEVGVPLRIDALVHNAGNVGAVPRVDVGIALRGHTIKTLTATAPMVGPGETAPVYLNWDTKNEDIASYTATIVASFGDTMLGKADRRFRVLAFGTLSRQGELESVALANKPKAGDYAKITATFRNTGQIETRAEFTGELSRDGSIVGVVKGAPRIVRAGDTVVLDALVRIERNGAYALTGKVNFEGKETREGRLQFLVRGFRLILLIGAILVLLAAGLTAYLVLARRRRRAGWKAGGAAPAAAAASVGVLAAARARVKVSAKSRRAS